MTKDYRQMSDDYFVSEAFSVKSLEIQQKTMPEALFIEQSSLLLGNIYWTNCTQVQGLGHSK